MNWQNIERVQKLLLTVLLAVTCGLTIFLVDKNNGTLFINTPLNESQIAIVKKLYEFSGLILFLVIALIGTIFIKPISKIHKNIKAKLLKTDFLSYTVIFLLTAGTSLTILPFVSTFTSVLFNLQSYKFLESQSFSPILDNFFNGSLNFSIITPSILTFLLGLLAFLVWIVSKQLKYKTEFQQTLSIHNDEPIMFETIQEIRGENKELFKGLENNINFLSNKINNADNELGTKKSAYVFCVNAEWGVGKTSFINMVKQKAEDAKKQENKQNLIWIDFNTWHYSSPDQIIDDFFNTLNKKIKERYGVGLGSSLRKYVNIIKEVEITTFGIKFSFKEIFPREPLSDLKDKICEKLKNIEENIVIVIDDIDRMEPEEVMTTIKLVKLLANFPRIIFILPFDYNRVSSLIVKKYDDTYSNYLQKIIQAVVTLEKYTYNELEAIFEYYVSDNSPLLKIKVGDKPENSKSLFERYSVRVFIRSFLLGMSASDLGGNYNFEKNQKVRNIRNRLLEVIKSFESSTLRSKITEIPEYLFRVDNNLKRMFEFLKISSNDVILRKDITNLIDLQSANDLNIKAQDYQFESKDILNEFINKYHHSNYEINNNESFNIKIEGIENEITSIINEPYRESRVNYLKEKINYLKFHKEIRVFVDNVMLDSLIISDLNITPRQIKEFIKELEKDIQYIGFDFELKDVYKNNWGNKGLNKKIDAIVNRQVF